MIHFSLRDGVEPIKCGGVLRVPAETSFRRLQ